MRHLLASLLFFALALYPAITMAAEGGGRLAVTVMPFVALDDNGEAWVGKALSDMASQKLAQQGGYTVLERDRLQAFLKEMELQEAGFTDKDQLQRLGGLAKVDRVIYGNYATDGSDITINLMMMEVESQKITAKAEITAPVSNLSMAAGKAVDELLGNKGSSAAVPEFRVTDNTSALEHFYKGLINYDNGKYEEAFADFSLAAKQDNKYLDARLWSGRMMEFTGNAEQAAIIYRKLYTDAPAAVEGRDALFFAAKLTEGSTPSRAIEDYMVLSDLLPKVPHSLEADMRLSMLYEKQGKPDKAFAALQRLQDFREETEKRAFSFNAAQAREEKRDFFDALQDAFRHIRDNKDDLSDDNMRLLAGLADVQMRQSRFFNWEHALNLYRGATMRMVALYREAVALDSSLKPPRGAYLVDPEKPEIGEVRFGDAKSLFFNDTGYSDRWREKFYAAIVPKGYVAEGVTLQVSGRVPSPTPTTDFTLRVFGYPLAKNYYNRWLGVVYGQTQSMTRLQKDIGFHGATHNVLVFQLIENNSKIRDWRVTFRLRKETGKPATVQKTGDGAVYEGREIARLPVDEEGLPGVSDPQYIEQYASKKRLALVDLGARGAWLVAARGDLGTGQTDLWASYSKNKIDWSPLQKMDVNSQSHDFAPRLVEGEDGAARLFWISNRRGLSWEIWTSGIGSGNTWGPARRVPLEKFMKLRARATDSRMENLLDFAAMQDNKGFWTLAVTPVDGKGIHLIATRDFDSWSRVAVADDGRKYYDPAIMQDKSGLYWLGGIDAGAKFRLFKSTNGQSWDGKAYALGSYSRHWSDFGNSNYGSVGQVAAYPVEIFSKEAGEVTLLFSDTLTGLQYARFRPDVAEPAPDLVRDISLEPYAMAQSGSGYIGAAWQGDDIVIRDYSRFAHPLNPENRSSDPLYRETETDEAGNVWDRRIARTRYIVSDVTAVGVQPDGRAWWGIETGVMSLKGDDFYISDVSMGFFYHQATDIVPCGDRTWFAARNLAEPLLGFVNSANPSRSTDKFVIAGATGSVSAISCDGGIISVGTTGGDIATIDRAEQTQPYKLPAGYATALAMHNGALWIGASDGKLYRVQDGKPSVERTFDNAVIALAAADGALWAASGGSLSRYNTGWENYAGKGLPDGGISKLRAAKGGVWFLPAPYAAGGGVGFFDGSKAKIYNPPSHRIFDTIDFDVASDGSVWVGSESSGIYRFERKAP
ncbi:MAG: FlgO family outer membrane protein [Alphaproteobacteria bacterium]